MVSSLDIAIEVSPGETRVALVGTNARAGGQLTEFHIQRRYERSLVGGIFLGRVRHIQKTHAGAFVDIGDNVQAFLANAKGLHEGEAVPVQVVRDAFVEKGPGVTRQISLTGRYLSMAPGRNGVTYSRQLGAGRARAALEKLEPTIAVPDAAMAVRAAAMFADSTEIEGERDRLLTRWAEIQALMNTSKAPALLQAPPGFLARILRDRAGDSRIIVDDAETFRNVQSLVRETMPDLYGRISQYRKAAPVFEALGLADEIDTLTGNRADIPGGGTMTIDQTEALTAIDLDRGAAGGSGGKEDAVQKFNVRAIREVARQVRLRNIAGLIVIDLLSMRQKTNKNAVLQAAKAAFRADPTPADVLDITAAGLLEVTRRRTGDAISSYVYRPLSLIKSPEAVACDVLRELARNGGHGPVTVNTRNDVGALFQGVFKDAFDGLCTKRGWPIDISTGNVRIAEDGPGFEIVEAPHGKS